MEYNDVDKFPFISLKLWFILYVMNVVEKTQILPDLRFVNWIQTKVPVMTTINVGTTMQEEAHVNCLIGEDVQETGKYYYFKSNEIEIDPLHNRMIHNMPLKNENNSFVAEIDSKHTKFVWNIATRS